MGARAGGHSGKLLRLHGGIPAPGEAWRALREDQGRAKRGRRCSSIYIYIYVYIFLYYILHIIDIIYDMI